MIFEKPVIPNSWYLPGPRPGLPLASATAKAVPAAIPVGLVKAQKGEELASAGEGDSIFGHQLVVVFKRFHILFDSFKGLKGNISSNLNWYFFKGG